VICHAESYSLDLRESVAGFVDSGRSRHTAAAHFKVSVSFVVNLMKAYRMTGRLTPKPGGGRRHTKLDPHRAFLPVRVAEKNDPYGPGLHPRCHGGHHDADHIGDAISKATLPFRALTATSTNKKRCMTC
jgi:transposase